METGAPSRRSGSDEGPGALAAALLVLSEGAGAGRDQGEPARPLPTAALVAIRQRLAGLFLEGLTAAGRRFQVPRDTLTALQEAARREAADDAIVARESEVVLARVAALSPVLLKGRALARQAWPRPWLRPAGDLDLLLDEPGLREAGARLGALGYRRAPGEAPLPLRAPDTGVELLPPPGRHLIVDLHVRLFRSVGERVDPARLLARALPASATVSPVAGCRVLDDADQLLYLAVHAAKHGLRQLKWLLDLLAVSRLADAAVWERVVRRARATRTERPLWAALATIPGLPGAAVPREVLDRLRPPPPWPRLLAALVSRENAIAAAPATRLGGYALELALEPSLRARSRRLGGVLVRIAGAAAIGPGTDPGSRR